MLLRRFRCSKIPVTKAPCSSNKNPGVQSRMQLEHNSREVTIVDANSERREDQVIASKSSNVWKAVTELGAATLLSSNSRSIAWNLEL